MRRAGQDASHLVAAAMGALALGYCGGDGPPGPAAPADPSASTSMISSSCAKLPPGRTDAPCGAGTSEFLGDVERAVRTLQSEQRSVFDGEQVLSVGAYYVGVIQILDRQGLCADSAGDELGVTADGRSNEQFDILSASRLAARPGPRRLHDGPRRDPDRNGLLRQVRRRGDRAQERLERVERAVRRQLPGPLHPDGRRHLPRKLLPGGILKNSLAQAAPAP